jgi:hypothetical protein
MPDASRWQQVRALTAIQRHACKVISGGFRLVSGDAYNAELQLLPMKRRLHKLRMQALARIATSPAYKRICERRIHHPSPLLQSPMHLAEEELQLTMDMDLDKLEVRQPFSVPPWWTAAPISIDRSMEAAVTNHNVNEIAHLNACRIYTDGSGINGLIRCAAVSLEPHAVRKAFMGMATELSVPIAELAGLILAFQIAEEPQFHGCDLEIYTDN